MTDLKSRIMAAVEGDLAGIETALRENLAPQVEIVSRCADHILFGGGKRLRPLLMVLCARLCGYEGTFDKTLSTVFEYLHAATLLHDDLVDGATLRRKREVAHAVFGNATAILVGDFLLARSLSIATETGSIRIMKIIAGITEQMSQGEIDQLHRKGDTALTEAEYMAVIHRKTAVLMEGACRVGALLAGADEEQEDHLGRFGAHLGMTFQMADDLLDYTAETGELGKTAGADLREGKLTLPVIRALAAADGTQRRFMTQVIREADPSPEIFSAFLSILDARGGIRYTRDLARDHAAKAKAALDDFPDGPTRRTLVHIADYALLRRT